MNYLTLPFPERREEIRAFCHKHHASRSSPGVWRCSHVATNSRDKICAVSMIGMPPYPSIGRAFAREPNDIPRLAWQCRMTGAGISSAELDQLLAFSNADLLARGFYWLLTLTDPVASTIDNALLKLISPGYTGEVYARNGFQYLGSTRRTHLAGWLIDGVPYHCRQGRTTLTKSNIHDHFPNAREIRALEGTAKHRWAFVYGSTAEERAQRCLLMKYHIQPWESTTQPRLLTRLLTSFLDPKDSACHTLSRSSSLSSPS